MCCHIHTTHSRTTHQSQLTLSHSCDNTGSLCAYRLSIVIRATTTTFIVNAGHPTLQRQGVAAKAIGSPISCIGNAGLNPEKGGTSKGRRLGSFARFRVLAGAMSLEEVTAMHAEHLRLVTASVEAMSSGTD